MGEPGVGRIGTWNWNFNRGGTFMTMELDGQVVHDRRSTDLPPRGVYDEVVVDDPYQVGQKILVKRQVRHDQLAWYYQHGHIDLTQKDAGRRYQSDWEMAEAGARAIDPTKENVDGGVGIDPIPERRMKATERLVAVEHTLGRYLVRIVQAILIHGATLDSMAVTCSKRDVEKIGREFRMGLELLAIAYGMSVKHHASRRAKIVGGPL